MDPETFEKLLQISRALRQRRRERLARPGLRRPRTAARKDAEVDVRAIRNQPIEVIKALSD